ncbi:hypothetical protein J437_LFUL016191 [Ladona fulva]|uniref:Uncharacterized protein n=1 Tax=Ladona fulva TaxID=123851 RepID=A0A8K0KIF1_LADFU|nr:hypothetical protein J437_LFUL016191 [Ladona fulva]
MDQCAYIEFYLESSESATETFKTIKANDFRRHMRFRDGREINEDNSRQGPSLTVRIEENNNRETTGIPISTFYLILTENWANGRFVLALYRAHFRTIRKTAEWSTAKICK